MFAVEVLNDLLKDQEVSERSERALMKRRIIYEHY